MPTFSGKRMNKSILCSYQNESITGPMLYVNVFFTSPLKWIKIKCLVYSSLNVLFILVSGEWRHIKGPQLLEWNEFHFIFFKKSTADSGNIFLPTIFR